MLYRTSRNTLRSRKLFFPILKRKNFAHIFIGQLSLEWVMLYRTSTNTFHSSKLFFLILKRKNFAHIFIGRIFAYSRTREQSNKDRDWKQRARLGRNASRFALPISSLILRKKPTVFAICEDPPLFFTG